MKALWDRVLAMIGLGRVTVGVNSGSVLMLQLQVTSDEIKDAVPALQHYGFESFPFPGADGVMAFLGGQRSKGIVIATNDQRYRLHVANGEVAIHDDQGQKVHITRAGIVIDGGGKPVTIQNTPEVLATTPLFKITGSLVASDCIANNGGSTAVSLFGHLTTGVQEGGGTSGPPEAA